MADDDVMAGNQPVNRDGSQRESGELQEMKRRKKMLEDAAQAEQDARAADNQSWYQRLFGTKPKG